MLRNLPVMRETQVLSLGWEDNFGEGNGNPFQYPCLEHSMDRGACGLYMGLQRVRHDTTEQLTHTPSASPEVITI